MAIETLNDIFIKTSETKRAAAMMFKKNDAWHSITVDEFKDRVKYISLGLRSLGVKTGDRVAILSENRPEWTLSDFAILAARAVSVPIYPTLPPNQVEYILNDSGSVAVICSTMEQLEKARGVCHHCPALLNTIVCDPDGPLPEGAMSIEQLMEKGREFEKSEPAGGRFEEILRSAGPGDLATIVYTSGTTGNQKGAMLTHGNITSNVAAATQIMPFSDGDIAMSILPLSHILERMADFCYFAKGGCVAYAESVQKVRDNLQEVKPHVFAGVPRLFEKMQMAIMENVANAPASKQKIFHWALKVGADRLPYRIEGKPMPPMLAFKSAVADRLVFRKILDRLGGNVRFVLSGGAPLSAELAAFFVGAGLEIYEGYGLTETSPVIAINTPGRRRLGTVGPVLPGVEVKIAADGEILSRGPHIMSGYFNNPEATAQAIDSEGWFHTGDIGEIDKDGFLRITDRKKDLIIDAYGKNIAPQPLEGLLKTSPYIATPVLIGDKRKYLSALIVPNFEKLERDAKGLGISTDDRVAMVNHPQIRLIVQKEIDRLNASRDRHEHVRKFALLPSDFTIESGEMTPSLKVKRKVVDQKYKELIDSLYVDEGTA